MILTSPLVVEKVWLDKPKYDAAERRYYESLSKSSVPPKTEASHNCSANSDIVCPKSVSDKNIEEGDPIVVEDNEISRTPLSGNVNEKVEQVTDVCVKPTKVPEAIKPATPEAKKKKKDSKSPPQKVDETKLEKDSTTQIKKDTNVCSLPSKPEKQKKQGALSQKNDSDSNISIASAKNESDEIIRSKVQSNAKDLEGKLLQALQNNQKIDTNITEQITDVTKLKGYFLQSKNLFSQTNNSHTKGTNVNTIPEISKLPCPEKSKSNNSGKKLNQVNQQLPSLDKQESTDLIIPTDSVSETVGDDQAKKDSKRKKRSKKERHRDKKGITQNPNSWNSLAGEVAKARQHIKNSLQCIDDIAVTSNTVSVEVTNRLVSLEKENQELTSRMEKMEQRIVALEKALQAATAAAAAVASRPVEKAAPKPQPPAPKPSNDDDDDGVDLFGSDSEEEDAEAAKIKEQRLAEYAARKAKKPVLIAKSNIILDVKPWDDETDMKLMEAEVRKIQCDGLVWGASKLVPLAYGIHKLQISCVVEDDKVSVDWLQESIEGIEDYVQSVDIAAFNKV